MDDRTQCYAFLGKNEVKASDTVITCTFVACDQMVNLLFNPGSTYSYVPLTSAFDFEMLCDILDGPIHISITLYESVIFTHVYHDFPILFMGFHTWADLVIFYKTDFVIILDMTWFSPIMHYAVLNCNAKSMTFKIP